MIFGQICSDTIPGLAPKDVHLLIGVKAEETDRFYGPCAFLDQVEDFLSSVDLDSKFVASAILRVSVPIVQADFCNEVITNHSADMEFVQVDFLKWRNAEPRIEFSWANIQLGLFAKERESEVYQLNGPFEASWWQYFWNADIVLYLLLTGGHFAASVLSMSRGDYRSFSNQVQIPVLTRQDAESVLLNSFDLAMSFE